VTSADFTALSPLIALGLTSILVMLSIALHRRHSVSLGISFTGLIVALVCVFLARTEVPRDVTILLSVDTFGLYYVGIIIVIGAIALTLGYSYLAHRESHPEEYYILMLIAMAGACAMALSTHFVSFYLGLEILSVAMYGLMAYVRRDRRGTEAGLKYLVLAAASAAFLLFGMALVYAELGTMQFAEVANASAEQVHNQVVLLGVAMMFGSIGFKLSIVPFHYWTPDIYEGAPPPVVGFMSTAGKLGVFAILIRYFARDSVPVSEALALFVAVTSAASMIVGNLLALIQTNIKRLLAYSSIAHMGYISIALLDAGEGVGSTITFYMIAYAAATLAAFGVIMAVSTGFGRARDREKLEDYRGLYQADPVLALVLAVSLLSLAGIPLTGGFLGKVYVLLAGADAGQWTLLVILALGSAAGAYYYLRACLMLFVNAPDGAEPFGKIVTPPVVKLLLVALAAVTLILGVFPTTLLGVLETLTASF